MKVVLHDHTGELTPALREYAERKLSRLERHFGKVADAEVDFTPERKRSGLVTVVCRINVHFDGRRANPLTAHEKGPDVQAALDLAFDKIDRQVVKTKEKRTHRKQAASAIRIPPDEPGPTRTGGEPERIRMKLRAETVEQAVAELMADGQNFHVFLEEDSGEIEIAFMRADGSIAIIEPVVT